MDINKKQFLPRKLVGGESSSVVLHRTGNKSFIIKHSVRNNLKNELIALKLARKGKVNVPNVIKYRNGNLFLEYIKGQNVKKSDLNSDFFKNLAGVLKKLHGVHTTRIGKITSPKIFSEKNWFNFLKVRLAKNVDFLLRNRKISKNQGKYWIDCWIRQLHQLPKRYFRPTLVHNDVHLDNILITPNKKLFLIDFEDSFYGDPLYDLVPFSDFHPRLFSQLKKFYNDKAVVSRNWQAWFKTYEFVHWISLAAFYVDIGKQKVYHRYLTKILKFCDSK